MLYKDLKKIVNDKVSDLHEGAAYSGAHNDGGSAALLNKFRDFKEGLVVKLDLRPSEFYKLDDIEVGEPSQFKSIIDEYVTKMTHEMFNSPISDMRRLVYKEDNQGYYYTPIIFETDSKIPVTKMSYISKETLGSGRHSTSFETFKKLMNEYGYVVNEIHRQPRNSSLELGMEVVLGATGNY